MKLRNILIVVKDIERARKILSRLIWTGYAIIMLL